MEVLTSKKVRLCLENQGWEWTAHSVQTPSESHLLSSETFQTSQAGGGIIDPEETETRRGDTLAEQARRSALDPDILQSETEFHVSAPGHPSCLARHSVGIGIGIAVPGLQLITLFIEGGVMPLPFLC